MYSKGSSRIVYVHTYGDCICICTQCIQIYLYMVYIEKAYTLNPQLFTCQATTFRMSKLARFRRSTSNRQREGATLLPAF